MITKLQIIKIHQAAGQIRKLNPAFDDAAYRTALRSIAGVESSKQLDNASFEQVMGFLESIGFREPNGRADYWRTKAARNARYATDRQLRLIEELASKTAYNLSGLCIRHSHNRTEHPAQLYPREAWNLIEALKAIVTRNSSGTGDSPVCSSSSALTQAEITQIERDCAVFS
jgi:hypothetical protein